MNTVDALGVMLAAGAIATLLGHAAITKLVDRALFEQHLAAYGVPMMLLPFAAWGIPLTEGALAVMLLTPWRPGAALLSAVLLVAYGLAMTWHLARGHALDCGCGGEPLAVTWWLVVRNAMLAAVALTATPAVLDRALGYGDMAALAASLALLALLYAALHEVLRIRLRIRAEADADAHTRVESHARSHAHARAADPDPAHGDGRSHPHAPHIPSGVGRWTR